MCTCSSCLCSNCVYDLRRQLRIFKRRYEPPSSITSWKDRLAIEHLACRDHWMASPGFVLSSKLPYLVKCSVPPSLRGENLFDYDLQEQLLVKKCLHGFPLVNEVQAVEKHVRHVLVHSSTGSVARVVLQSEPIFIGPEVAICCQKLC